ncbi:hypothetical protein [Pseudonocardia sp.]
MHGRPHTLWRRATGAAAVSLALLAGCAGAPQQATGPAAPATC